MAESLPESWLSVSGPCYPPSVVQDESSSACSKLGVVAFREIQIKSTIQHHITPLGSPKSRCIRINVGEERETQVPCWWEGSWCSCFGNDLAVSQTNTEVPCDPTFPLLGTCYREMKALVFRYTVQDCLQ